MIQLKQNKIEHNGMDRMEWNSIEQGRIEQNRKGEKKRKKEMKWDNQRKIK